MLATTRNRGSGPIPQQTALHVFCRTQPHVHPQRSIVELEDIPAPDVTAAADALPSTTSRAKPVFRAYRRACMFTTAIEPKPQRLGKSSEGQQR
jgi:hypothetical protein